MSFILILIFQKFLVDGRTGSGYVLGVHDSTGGRVRSAATASDAVFEVPRTARLSEEEVRCRRPCRVGGSGDN